MIDKNKDRLPHKNPNNFDPYSIPVVHQVSQKQSAHDMFPDSKLVASNYSQDHLRNQNLIQPFPNDIQQPYFAQTRKENLDNKQLYWTQNEQKWITLSYNLNPLGFATNDMFRSLNVPLTSTPNPIACIFVFLFKAIMLICYFCYTYFGDKILLFELLIILGALDFWIIKNICGRILVGLRWWVEQSDDGVEQWVFETQLTKMTSDVQKIHSRLFWFISLFMAFMFIGILIANLLTLQFDLALSLFFPTCLISFNLWAFNMCNKVKKSRMGVYMLKVSTTQNQKSMKLPMKIQ